MSQEKLHQTFNYLFLGTGTTTAGIALNLQTANDIVGLIVKGISILSFLCYLLINQGDIEKGWYKFINRFKKEK